jgi:hypothetical protein
MSRAYEQLPVRLGAGVNLVDAPEAMHGAEAQALTNLEIPGIGRWTPRKSARSILSLTGEVIGGIEYGHTTYTPDAGGASRDSAAVVLTYAQGAPGTVRLYLVDANGGGPKYVGNLAGWAPTAQPAVSLAVLGTVLFICDEGQTLGLTCYDPNNVMGSGAANGLYQPTFDFNADTVFAKAQPAGVEVHENVLFTWGYYAESASSYPDRPEIVRFSYIGLEADSTGSGDAGSGGAAGSAGIFDREDAFYLTRGEPVRQCRSTEGMLAVATPFRVFRMYGSDRFNLQKTPNLLDPDRGTVSSRAMVNADGVLYWLTPLGGARFAGGVQQLPNKIRSRLREMNVRTVFAVHARDQHQVRWYYALSTEAGQDPDRYIAYDYVHEQWIEGLLPFRVRCAFWIRPGTGAAATYAGPAAAPSALTHSSITDTAATAEWTNGDTSPAVKTRVYRAPDSAGSPGAYTLVAELDSGISSYRHTGLAATTTYWTKVLHVLNGVESTAAEASFTTEVAGFVAKPLNPIAEVVTGGVQTSWDLGQTGVRTEVWSRDDTTGEASGMMTRTAVDATSYKDPLGTANHRYKFRHVDAADNLSEFTVEIIPAT